MLQHNWGSAREVLSDMSPGSKHEKNTNCNLFKK
uniref:Uncharacterized protein n=1 Tax=Anguilla anguilla TaxID=7936 RepID=A0A0E9P7M9_ANGAN